MGWVEQSGWRKRRIANRSSQAQFGGQLAVDDYPSGSPDESNLVPKSKAVETFDDGAPGVRIAAQFADSIS